MKNAGTKRSSLLVAAAVATALGSLHGDQAKAQDNYYLWYSSGGQAIGFDSSNNPIGDGSGTPFKFNYGLAGILTTTAAGSFDVSDVLVFQSGFEGTVSGAPYLAGLVNPSIGQSTAFGATLPANQKIDPSTTVDASAGTGFGAFYSGSPGSAANGIGFNFVNPSFAKAQLYGPEGATWFEYPGLNLKDSADNLYLSNASNYNVVPVVTDISTTTPTEYFLPAPTTTYTGTTGGPFASIAPTLSATVRNPTSPADCPVDFYIVGTSTNFVSLIQLATDAAGNVSGTGPTLSTPDVYTVTPVVSLNVRGFQTRNGTGNVLWDSSGAGLGLGLQYPGTDDGSGNVNFVNGFNNNTGPTFTTNPSTLRKCGAFFGQPPTATITVGSSSPPPRSVTGGGNYVVPTQPTGSTKQNFGIVVNSGIKKQGGVTYFQQKGALQWNSRGGWRLHAKIDTQVVADGSGNPMGPVPLAIVSCPTSNSNYWQSATPAGATCGRLSTTGVLSKWDATLNDGLGDWTVVDPSIPFTATMYDGGQLTTCAKKVCKTTDQTDYFGLQVTYTDPSNTLAVSDPVAVSSGGSASARLILRGNK